MKMANKIVISCFLVGVSGCINPEAFRPSPPYYESWGKMGATELDVKKALLECGDTHPAGGPKESLNEVALVYYCMVGNGYTPRGFKGRIEDSTSLCRIHADLPICQPDALVPKPSIELRLNSRYCRQYLNYNDCLSYLSSSSVGVHVCSRRNYRAPPLECLP